MRRGVWLACVLCVGGVWAATQSNEAQLKALRQRIESVRQSIQADAERRDSLVGELKQADESIQTARQELAGIRSQRREAEQQLKQLQNDQAAAQTQLAGERAALAKELRLSYMNGRNESLKLLLNQQDPAQLGRMLSYYSYFGRARAEHMQEINDQLAHLALLEDDISAEAERLRGIEQRSERSAKALSQARQTRASTLAQVEGKLKTGNQRLSKLKSDAQALEKLIAKLREEAQRAAEQAKRSGGKALPAPTGRGSWPWPVKGDVLARFGQLRSGGPLKWEGMVIGAGEGTQVRAPAAGRVLYADWLPGLGLLLVVDHGGGIMSLYGHNEQLYKQVGDTVARGDALSVVGDTGVEGHTGVYLEIRSGKNPVDPLNWLGQP